jgi:hypothetical protein
MKCGGVPENRPCSLVCALALHSEEWKLLCSPFMKGFQKSGQTAGFFMIRDEKTDLRLITLKMEVRRRPSPVQNDFCNTIGHNPTLALQQSAPLFDRLVGGREQRRRHVNAEEPGGLQVDHQLESGRLHHRHVSGLEALEDAVRLGSAIVAMKPANKADNLLLRGAKRIGTGGAKRGDQGSCRWPRSKSEQFCSDSARAFV